MLIAVQYLAMYTCNAIQVLIRISSVIMILLVNMQVVTCIENAVHYVFFVFISFDDFEFMWMVFYVILTLESLRYMYLIFNLQRLQKKIYCRQEKYHPF